MFTFDRALNIIVVICELSLVWMGVQTYRKDKGETAMAIKVPSRRWLLIVLFSLLPIGALIIHNLAQDPIQEFDEPQNRIVTSWGRNGQGCTMDVDQRVLQRFRLEYKLATACLIYDGTQDLLDDPYMQVGGLYDIDEHLFVKKLMAGFSQNFKEEYTQKRSHSVYVALLLVPKGIEPSQFATLRQARALGVRIPYIGIASAIGVTAGR